ncbi:MAG: YhgN family NAAT transporter [Proteobacteria bacterium]|nr:YhgN family NAAT transporter [Pseudomonadota bacterium]
MSTLSAGILLFLILDPLGNIPLFLSLLKGVAPERRRRVMLRELLIALAALFAFLLGGSTVLAALQLRTESVSIAGGIVLFLIGVKMIFPPREGGIFGASPGGEPFIVPLAIPGVAGPSAMAALLLLTNSHPGRTADWSIAVFGAWLATALILLSSTWLFRLLGAHVLTALERLMGMLLVALSVQMFLDGVVVYLGKP